MSVVNKMLMSVSVVTAISINASAETTTLEDVTVVSASGFEQNIADAPASITVISADEIEKKAYSNVLDAVKNVPGLFINGGGGTELDIDIRGMGSEFTLYLIDGKPISSSRNIHAGSQERSGKVAGNLPNIDMIERIEIIRGPMSSLYGSEAMGGVINIITKKISDKWTGSFSTEYTKSKNNISNDSKNGSLYISGPLIEDKLSLSINAFKEQLDEGNTDIEDTGTEADIEKIGGRLNLKLSDKNNLGFEYSHTRQDNTETVEGEDDNEYGQIKNMYALTDEHIEENYSINTYIQMDSARALKGKNQKEDILTSNIQGTYLFDEHIVTIGAQYKEEEFESDLNINQGKVDRWLSAIFIEDEWSLSDDFALTLGARYNYDEYFNGELTPRVYGVYNLNDNWTLKGGVSTGYKQPGIVDAVDGYASEVSQRGSVIGVEVGNPDLEPEKSISYEAGFNFSLAEYDFNSSLMVFRTHYKNKLVDNYTCGDKRNTAKGCFYNGVDYRFTRELENVDEAQTQGIEFTADYKLFKNLKLGTNYSFTQTEQKTGENTGKPLNEIPKHMANVTLDWDMTHNLTSWAQYNYRGKVRDTSDVEYLSYYFADIGVVYEATDSLSLKAGVYNFTDREVTEEGGYDTVLDGRRVIVGLNYKF